MTDFLFATPSVIEGIGRIFDFAGSLQAYNESSTTEEADTLALYNDFKAVGRDIYEASEKFNKTVINA